MSFKYEVAGKLARRLFLFELHWASKFVIGLYKPYDCGDQNDAGKYVSDQRKPCWEKTKESEHKKCFASFSQTKRIKKRL
jgi:hypothetical protein